MHELFKQVLNNRDLSRAGDLFSVSDSAIVNDLTKVLKEIRIIISLDDYNVNSNDQSVVEICVTRVTSCIRETGSIEQHCDALIQLLETCAQYNLEPTQRDEDPPHAKISADIISSIFLNYSKRNVMEKAIPIGVKFLHKGNKELSRNLASYLSLAALEHADLLSSHLQSIIDSIISGNYSLCRVLCQIYEVTKSQLENQTVVLVSLLPLCENQDRLALLNLFSLIAKNTPAKLEGSVSDLCEYLNDNETVLATMEILINLVNNSSSNSSRQLLANDSKLVLIKQAIIKYPHSVCLGVQLLVSVCKINKERAQDALNFILEQLPKQDGGQTHHLLMREATILCSSYPILFTDKLLAGIKHKHSTVQSNTSVPSSATVTSNGVTIVKVGAPPPQSLNVLSMNNSNNNNQTSLKLALANNGATSGPGGGGGVYTRRAKLGDSRSTGRLHTSAANRSMTRLNIASGSVGGLHKSMTRLSSSQQINSAASIAQNQPAQFVQSGQTRQEPQMLLCNNALIVPTNNNKWLSPRISSGGVTVTTPLPALHAAKRPPHSQQSSTLPNSVTVSNNLIGGGGTGSAAVCSSGYGGVSVSGPLTTHSVTSRNRNTSVTIINNSSNLVAAQRMSVFEPYPMRDTVQHFCEKHLDKIKNYMDKVSIRIPPPAKCTIEERRAKKLAKLHFACQQRGEHCLYSRSFFTMRTRNPRIWIHLMFLALQARATHALSSRDSSVTSLKHCWDMLKCENKTFLTLVTSAFPCQKDQETLLNELRHCGFFDVFELGAAQQNGTQDPITNNNLQWGCFLCTHPEKAIGFLRSNTQPVIEGQLKEKKGRWRLFRRWRTRYFTLSGAHLSVKTSTGGGESIDINQIRSVKVSRGARNIPKAFEIFTEDHQSLILKPKDGQKAEEWVQCLSIVVAHSAQSRHNTDSKTNSLPARGLTASRTAL